MSKLSSRQSTYERIEESLRTRIADQDWPPGTILPGRRRLAEEYGVALATIQRAVAGLLREGVLRTDSTIGTFVAPGPRPVRSNSGAAAERSHGLQIGILLDEPDLTTQEMDAEAHPFPFFALLADGIRSVIAAEGAQVTYLHQLGRPHEDVFEQSGCDGLLLVAGRGDQLEQIYTLASNDRPFVAMVTWPRNGQPDDIPCVDADNPGGARQALEHLVGLGHRKIGMVNLALASSDHFERFQTFFDFMAKHNMPLDPGHVLMYGGAWRLDLFEPKIKEWIEGLRAENRLPTAIFCADLGMTLETLKVLNQQGLNVPRDVSLVGFDDTPLAAHFSPPLTLVRQPVYEIGRRAARRLLDHLKTSSGRLFGAERVPTELIIRASTAPPRS